MLFCPNCDNFFNISRVLEENDMKGGAKVDFEEVIDNILNNLEFDPNVNIDELAKSDLYKKLSTKQKQYIYNKIQDTLPKNKKEISVNVNVDNEEKHAIYICKKCGYVEDIVAGTEILSRTSENVSQNYEVTDYKDMLNSKILPFTRKYFCPNEKCKSHTDMNEREAIFFRLNNSYKTKYICESCGTDF